MRKLFPSCLVVSCRSPAYSCGCYADAGDAALCVPSKNDLCCWNREGPRLCDPLPIDDFLVDHPLFILSMRMFHVTYVPYSHRFGATVALLLHPSPSLITTYSIFFAPCSYTFTSERHPSNNSVVLQHGRIIVHDRNRVQSEVLPIYFNHASFASLRRQLSYFCFVRVGKSRQSGVTYANEMVVDLADILKLKRRVAGPGTGGGGQGLSTTAVAGSTKGQLQSRQQQQQQKLKKKRQKKQSLNHQREQQKLARDVASAMLSGTLHAAKTNDNLDVATNNINSGSAPGMPTDPYAPGARANSTSQSSISHSMSPSSSSTSSEAGGGGGGRDKTKSRGDSDGPAKNPRKKSRAPPKHSLPRKDRIRLDRLLSVNNIVPFIHLPTGVSLSGDCCGSSVSNKLVARGREGSSSSLAANSGGGSVRGPKKSSGWDRATSDGAVNALLALGGTPQ